MKFMIDDLDRLHALASESAELTSQLDGVNAERRALAVDLYRRGVGFSQVVETAGVSDGALSGWLRDAGVTPHQGNTGRGHKRSDDVRERAVAAALNRPEGVTVADVAAEFGIHKVTLHRWVNAAS